MKTTIIRIAAIFIITACSCKKHAATDLEKIAGDHTWSGIMVEAPDTTGISFSGKITLVSGNRIVFSAPDIQQHSVPDTMVYVINPSGALIYGFGETASSGNAYRFDTIIYVNNKLSLRFHSLSSLVGWGTDIYATTQ
jgi:hypothetical protein